MAVELTAPTREQTRARYPDESGYVVCDGVRIWWESYGTGEPAILLLPTLPALRPARTSRCIIASRCATPLANGR